MNASTRLLAGEPRDLGEATGQFAAVAGEIGLASVDLRGAGLVRLVAGIERLLALAELLELAVEGVLALRGAGLALLEFGEGRRDLLVEGVAPLGGLPFGLEFGGAGQRLGLAPAFLEDPVGLGPRFGKGSLGVGLGGRSLRGEHQRGDHGTDDEAGHADKDRGHRTRRGGGGREQGGEGEVEGHGAPPRSRLAPTGTGPGDASTRSVRRRNGGRHRFNGRGRAQGAGFRDQVDDPICEGSLRKMVRSAPRDCGDRLERT